MALGKKMLWCTGILIAVAIVIGPVYLLVKYSISDLSSINTGGEPIPLWPYHPTLAIYKYLFTDARFYQVLFNSIIIALSTVLLSMVLGVPAAYVLGRYKIPGRKTITIRNYICTIVS